MTAVSTSKDSGRSGKSWTTRFVVISIALMIIVDVIWLGWPTIEQTYQAWTDRRNAALDAKMLLRQQAFEKQLQKSDLPVFGGWEQCGPFGFALADVCEAERNPDRESRYHFVGGKEGGWTPIPQYIDGYSNRLNLKGIEQQAYGKSATVCLARTITSSVARMIPVYLGADGGFVIWLNGKSLLLSDARDEPMRPGQEIVELNLQPGENRLVMKIKLDRAPYQFFFQPDFGKERTDDLLTSLERDFPISRRRSENYREHAAISATITEEESYPLTEIPAPEGILLEGGGLGFLPDGRLAVGTRRGFVYLVSDILKNDPSQATFTQFGAGLHEVLGMNISPSGEMDVVQRGSVVRLKDRDGDGQADSFQNLNNEWGVSGNYHEYALDLERDQEGNCYTSLCLSDLGGGSNSSLAPFRGWIVQITPDRQLVPWCFGLRCGNGLGWNAAGDLFATDNQGQWVPACPIHHVRRDHYFGSPASLESLPLVKSDEAHRRATQTPTPPAVWMPYEEFCMSATDLVCDRTLGRFGPFADQLFVGDMMKGTIIRAALEKVDGEYQGACFLFRRGVGAVNRMIFGPDHRLYLTRVARGWGGGGRGEGLARLEFTGETPMEIESIHLKTDGFQIRFTSPLEPRSKTVLRDIRIEQFRYEYWEKYGSPKMDRELLSAGRLEMSDDRRALTIQVRGIKPGRVCHLKLPPLKTESGRTLLHPDAFYTVNRLVPKS